MTTQNKNKSINNKKKKGRQGVKSLSIFPHKSGAIKNSSSFSGISLRMILCFFFFFSDALLGVFLVTYYIFLSHFVYLARTHFYGREINVTFWLLMA